MADTSDPFIEGFQSMPVGDIEMAGGGGSSGSGSGGGKDETAAAAAAAAAVMPFAEMEAPEDSEAVPERMSFMTYLASPVVTLIVGSGQNETILTAHQSLLTLSPFFREECAQFSDDGSVSGRILP